MTTYTTIPVTFTDDEIPKLDAYCEQIKMSREYSSKFAIMKYMKEHPITSSALDSQEPKGNV